MLNKNNLHVGSLLTTNIMSRGQNTDFKAMSVAAIKKYLQERGVSVNGYLKPGVVQIAVAVDDDDTCRSQLRKGKRCTYNEAKIKYS